MISPQDRTTDQSADPLTSENIGGDGRPAPEGPPSPAIVLAAYGTLAPGESNHRIIAEVVGEWYRGTIRGHRWTWERGPYEGLPAFRLDPNGERIPVAVLVSDRLPTNWTRLDAFEGDGYRRVATMVTFDGEEPFEQCIAQVYEAINDPDGYDNDGYNHD